MGTLQSQIAFSNPAAATNLNAMLRWARPYESAIYKLALGLTGHQEDADRVLADTITEAWHQFVLSANQLPTLLDVLRIAVRESVSALRLRAGDLAGWVEEPDSELGRVSVPVEKWGEDLECLFQPHEWRRIRQLALETLTPLDRAVFLLRDVQRFSEVETEFLLDRPATAVKVRLLRARLRLREWLNPLCRVAGVKNEIEMARV